jgi:hypothetical protein
MRRLATSALLAGGAVLALGCASAGEPPSEARSFAEMHTEILRACDDLVRPCPLVLLDTRPVADYTDAQLAAIPAASIDYIDVTKGACLAEWRFGVTGYAQVIVIYTKGFEGERFDHAPMTVEYEMLCEFDGWQADQPDGSAVTDAVGDVLDPASPEGRTLADAVVGAFEVCMRFGQGCPLVLIDTRPSAEFSRAELEAVPLTGIANLEATVDACAGVWRFGERGRNGAIEIYTDGFDGEALRHDPIPEEELRRCRAEASRRSPR